MLAFRVLFVILLLPICAIAQDDGGTRSPFDLGGSARALGMGGAVAAVTDGADGYYWNPAILAVLQKNEIQTFHTSLFLDTIYDSLAYFHPLGRVGGFGVAISRIGTSNIFMTSGNVNPISTIDFELWQGSAGYGFEVIEGLDIGANVKYVRQQVGDIVGSGMGLDMGMLYRLAKERKDYAKIGFRNITVGLSVSNLLSPQAKLVTLADQPARVFHAALSYLYRPSENDSLWIAFEGEQPEAGGSSLFKAGVEYGWNNTLFGRAGFDGSGPTAGAGIRLIGLELNYAFNQKDLGTVHRFSLTYRFGAYKDPLQAKRIELLKWVAKSFAKSGDFGPAIQAWQNVLKEFPEDGEARKSIKDLQERRKKLVSDDLQQAKKALAEGNMDKALPLISKVMSLDPGNPEAKAMLAQVDRKLLVSTHYIQGVEAYGKEDYETAVEYLGMVYEVDPQYRDVGYLYNDAQSHYLPLQSMPKELTELYAKGVDYYMTGQFQQAVDVWQKVLMKNPNNFLVQRNLEEARGRMKEKAAPASQNTGNKK